MTETTFAAKPAITETRPWEFPTPVEFTVSNGLSARHFELPGQQICSVEILLRAGTAQERAGQEGLCALTAEVLLEGDSATDSAGFARALQACAAYVRARATTTGTILSITAPGSRIRAALTLIADALISPRFADADVERLRTQQIDEIMMDDFDLSSRAHREFAALFYAADRRERIPTLGTAASVGALTRDDVVEFHRSHITPSSGVVVIVGDLPLEEAQEILEAGLGRWTGSTTTTPPGQPAFAPATTGLVGVDIDDDDSPLTELICAIPAPRRTDPGWADIATVANALGGSMESLLNVRLREEKGFTYGVSAAMHAFADHSFLFISGSVDSAATEEATRDLVDVVATVLHDGLQAEDHARAVGELTTGEALAYQQSSDISGQSIRQALWGLDHDWPNVERRAIAATTLESIRATTSALALDQALVVVVGSDLTSLPGWEELGRSVSTEGVR